MKLEERLIQLRKANSLSQGDLAKMVQVSRQTISRWETGVAVPSAENAKCLSELYGISVDTLLHGKQTPLSAEKTPENTAPAQSRDKKKLAVLLAVVLLVGVTVGVIWWKFRDENADDDIFIMDSINGLEFETGEENFDFEEIVEP